MHALWLLQAQSQAEPHIDSDSIMEGLQGADGPPLPKKKGLFKRGWGSGHKGTGEKQVKPSKSKLNEGSASLAQKSAGITVATCKVLHLLVPPRADTTGRDKKKAAKQIQVCLLGQGWT